MMKISINGSQLELRKITGSASLAPLVFLHEGLGSVSQWTQRGLDWPQALCAVTGRAAMLYSRRGYGQSEPVPDVRGAGHLGPDYMHREAWEVLLGHSDGATIALLHASRYPVTACVAMAPHVLVEDLAIASIAQARKVFQADGPGDQIGRASLRARLARHHADVDGAFWQWNDVWLSPAFRSFDIRAECRAISAPLLLIQGLDDEYGTLRQLDEIALAAPQARQLRLAACGHSPQRDQPDKSLQAIADFLKELP